MNNLKASIAAALLKEGPQVETHAQRLRALAEKAVGMPVQATSAPQRGQTAKDAYHIVLPYPPSANHFKAVIIGSDGEPRMVKTKQARDYCKQVKAEVEWRFVNPLVGPLKIEMEVIRPTRSGDIDNYTKVCFDSLSGIAWVDDGQIVDMHVFFGPESRTDPKVILKIEAQSIVDRLRPVDN